MSQENQSGGEKEKVRRGFSEVCVELVGICGRAICGFCKKYRWVALIIYVTMLMISIVWLLDNLATPGMSPIRHAGNRVSCFFLGTAMLSAFYSRCFGVLRFRNQSLFRTILGVMTLLVCLWVATEFFYHSFVYSFITS